MVDAILAGAIVCGAVYLLYRSIWTKKGFCPGCDCSSCPTKLEKKDSGCH